MARQFKIQDEDWGEYLLFSIHQYDDGTWEKKWDLFRTHPVLQIIGDLFTKISFNSYQDALRNHGLPLIKELGPPPEACFMKLEESYLLCKHRKPCATYDPEGCLASGEPPPCFESNIVEEDMSANALVKQVYDMWREGFYIVIAPYSD